MGSIRDRNIGWLRKRIYIPVTGFGGYNINFLISGGVADAAGRHILLTTDAGTSGFGKTDATDRNAIGATAATDRGIRQQSIGNGVVRLAAIPGNVDHQGLLCVLAADGVEYFGMIPYDIDVSKPVGFRVWWSSAAAAVGNRTITWGVKRGLTKASAAPAVVTTALDTTITAQAPVGTANALQRGNRGIMSADTILRDHFFWGFEVLMAAFHADFTEDKFMLGLEIDYAVRATFGTGKLRDTLLQTDPFGFEQE